MNKLFILENFDECVRLTENLNIINEFENNTIEIEDNQYLTEELLSMVAAASVGAIAGRLTRYFIDRYKVNDILANGKKRCDKYSGKQKEKCLMDVRKVFLEKKIHALQQAMAKCGDNKKCRETIAKQITKAQEERKKNDRNVAGFGLQPSYDIAKRGWFDTKHAGTKPKV